MRTTGWARMGGRELSGVVECVPDLASDPARMGTAGHWVLVGEFDGPVRAWRFAESGPVQVGPGGRWHGPPASGWRSSLDRQGYLDRVRRVRAEILDGWVYQVNLCRVLSAPVECRGGPPSAPSPPEAAALADCLAAGHNARYAGAVQVPPAPGVEPVWVVTASPELFCRMEGGRIWSGPIKGTARTAAGLTAKDRAENVMITDLVRNDLHRICRAGTVRVEELLTVEQHPGLVHLVSTISGELRRGPADEIWARLLAAAFPPGSVSGAPKSSALRLIGELEPVPRGPYCGLVGWAEVAPDGTVRAELAVGIRTFWWTAGMLYFGTGAGITWGSDPEREWAETELKTERLIGLASAVAA